MVFPCSGKVLEPQPILNGQQHFSIRLQERCSLAEESIGRVFARRGPGGILHDADDHHVVILVRQLHGGKIVHHNVQIFLRGVPLQVDIRTKGGFFHRGNVCHPVAQIPGQCAAACADFQHRGILLEGIPVDNVGSQGRKVVDDGPTLVSIPVHFTAGRNSSQDFLLNAAVRVGFGIIGMTGAQV